MQTESLLTNQFAVSYTQVAVMACGPRNAHVITQIKQLINSKSHLLLITCAYAQVSKTGPAGGGGGGGVVRHVYYSLISLSLDI